MTKTILTIVITWVLVLSSTLSKGQQVQSKKIDLSGSWAFAIDSLDQGVKEKWFNKKFGDKVRLPGSMTTNGKGDEITLKIHWTGDTRPDGAYWKDSSYAKYRQPENIKVPFWLQPNKVYVGPAWYQKEVTIPKSWSGQHIALFLERCHWETMLWIDGKQAGMQNALGAPHRYTLDQLLTPGKHTLVLRIDNRIKDIDPGRDAHSISDHTQTNWNGIIGKLELIARPTAYLSSIQLYPDIDKKVVLVKVTINNIAANSDPFEVNMAVQSKSAKKKSLPILTKMVRLGKDTTQLTFTYNMGPDPALWDEFTPNLYTMKISLKGKKTLDTKDVTFGMRQFVTKGQQFLVNKRPTFLRGTLECAIFPKTGFPPTDKTAWARIYKICQSYGLNHVRFHSWCPPEAAFAAADEAGIYLSVECSAWAAIGDGKPIDKFIYEESKRIVNAFGNHPSFCMLAYGNEPAGTHSKEFLTSFIKYWKEKDARRLYTSGSGWPIIPESDYNSTGDPRIGFWGTGFNSVLNNGTPRTDYDWSSIVNKWPQPTVSHEIGQWCVYPDFKEIKKYDGVLKPKNFDIFYDRLKENHLETLADSFFYASGKLQVLCYKNEIEAALRTPNFGGFQLLDLHDFPGQGTALVGVLDPFWNSKGYVSAAAYSSFCNAVVPLFRTKKLIYKNDEFLDGIIEIANFGRSPLKQVTPKWQLKNQAGKILFQGHLKTTDIAIGNNLVLGHLKHPLSTFSRPEKLSLQINVGDYQNSWDIFVYPSQHQNIGNDILVTQTLDEKALHTLDAGGKVLLTTKKGIIKENDGGNVMVGFSPIFWNLYWSNNQPPHTLGILCDPKHPAFSEFPTDYYSNWQWQDGLLHCNAIRLDHLSKDLKPIVRIIDDWYTARPLGLIVECSVGKGSLLISGIDLLTDNENRLEAKQLLYSLKAYMSGPQFNPSVSLSPQSIRNIFK
ncbi:glycoside hydrolase family 2 TIM barrel-domain containing protein [Olivibacter ginsenosidimutans]|uniref:beta-galactosidase n=1 Tax=Olivibacter ginsenosidimutans TaxID=1176537 RepID=A0ABP9BK01_9SPHI